MRAASRRGPPLALAALLAGLLAVPFRLAAAPISFSADGVQSTLAKGRERTILTGRASVRTGSLSISADRIELFGDDFRYLDCSGSVRVVDGEQELLLETPRLYYDRTKKLTRAQGPSVLQDEKNELVLKAEWIENDGEAEVTVAQVAVRIIKGKIATRSEYAVYRRKDKALELTGSPSAYRDGDSYKASRITVDIETEDIKLEGSVSGSVTEKKPAGGEPAPGSEGAPGDPIGAPKPKEGE
jgi:lipopolysaccharide export system protein LptA